MFQSTQNEQYLKTCIDRVKNNYLVWVEQFLDCIEARMDLTTAKTLNDVGCNLGQFWKGLKRRNLNLDYHGYDIDPIYLNEAVKIFPELEGKVSNLDLERQHPRKAQISVISATLEHLTQFQPALDRLLETTSELVLIRTFLGDKPLTALRQTEGAKHPYPVNQYSFLKVFEILEKHGFSGEVLRDRFTDSMPKYLGQGILRTQYVVVASRPAGAQ
ncbi:MAG: class I SAM-dependent methyltransferase [Bdellovibrionota bacterium]